jgi:hypothetical protein
MRWDWDWNQTSDLGTRRQVDIGPGEGEAEEEDGQESRSRERLDEERGRTGEPSRTSGAGPAGELSRMPGEETSGQERTSETNPAGVGTQSPSPKIETGHVGFKSFI